MPVTGAGSPQEDLMDTTAVAPAATDAPAAVDAPDASGVEQELLVEDVSIDGMCGVY
jgi:mycofactocin precursor